MTKKGILSKLRNNGYAVSIGKSGHFFAKKGDERFSNESLNGLFKKVFGYIEEPVVVVKVVKPKPLTKTDIKEKVYLKCGGKCAYCGSPLGKKWTVDKINPKIDDSNNFINLNPSCQGCKLSKRNFDLRTFRRYSKMLFNEGVHHLFKTKGRMQTAMNMGVIVHKEWDGLFYFEKLKKHVQK